MGSNNLTPSEWMGVSLANFAYGGKSCVPNYARWIAFNEFFEAGVLYELLGALCVLIQLCSAIPEQAYEPCAVFSPVLHSKCQGFDNVPTKLPLVVIHFFVEISVGLKSK